MWNLHRERVSPPQDTTLPETTIGSGPSGTVKQNNASFTFSCSEAGSSFSVTATDAARNTDDTLASRTWTIRR